MANLDWLVVRDFSLIESATWWQDGPEIETGELRTEDIGTEVFFFPAAAHTEKSGSFTNTNRLAAVAPRGRRAGRRRAQRPVVHVPPRPAHQGAAGGVHRSDGPADARPDLGLPDRGAARGAGRRGRAGRDQRARTPTGAPLSRVHGAQGRRLDPCGCWIYCGVYADGVNQAARRKPAHRAGLGRRRVGLGLAARTGASSTTAPRPTPTATRGATRKALRLVGRRRRAAGPATTSPTSFADRAPDYRTAGRTPRDLTPCAATTRSSCRPTARAGCTRRPGCSTGRCPRTTSRRTPRSPTPLYPDQQRNPAPAALLPRGQPLPPQRRRAGRRGLSVRA